jgi:hypothetical protein
MRFNFKEIMRLIVSLGTTNKNIIPSKSTIKESYVQAGSSGRTPHINFFFDIDKVCQGRVGKIVLIRSKLDFINGITHLS